MTTPVRRPHPDSRWFSTAALGIWFDWSITPSPALAPAPGSSAATPQQRDALARGFDPGPFDPAKWLVPAAQAGCRYAVMTARDANGYAFWPSAFGELGTRATLDGRDLIQPFVDACRRTGLKLGLHFALGGDAVDRQQLDELLVRYDALDVLVLSGNPSAGLIEALWARRPALVVGTGGDSGDFQVMAAGQRVLRPEGWSLWSHRPDLQAQTASAEEAGLRQLLIELVEARARGGNLLLACTPDAQGALPPTYERLMTGLRLWMGHSGEAIVGTRSGPWPDQSDVPATTRGDTWYLHFPSAAVASAQVDAVGRPNKTALLRTGASVAFEYLDGSLTVTLPPENRSALVDVVAVTGLTVSQR